MAKIHSAALSQFATAFRSLGVLHCLRQVDGISDVTAVSTNLDSDVALLVVSGYNVPLF